VMNLFALRSATDDTAGPIAPLIDRRRFLRITLRTALTASLLGGSVPVLLDACGSNKPASNKPASDNSSDQLFEAGRFADADKGYTWVLSRDPKDVHAIVQRGQIALLSNRLTQAQTWFNQALTLDPNNRQARQLLALTLYRADRFDQAAEAGYLPPLMQSFHGFTPYDIHGPDVSRVPFLQTHPILLVDVSINGSEPVPFAVDTGSNTILMHPDFATGAGVAQIASSGTGGTAISAGGQPVQAGQLGRVDRMTIGDFDIRNIPSTTVATISAGMLALDGRPVQGAIGTTLLSHFLSTLDYRGATLVLRRKTAALLRQVEQGAKARLAAVMPFWIYQDHFIIAIGTVNGHGPMLLTIDTGAAGDYGSMALLPTDAAISEANIQVDKTKTMLFLGGGGAFTAYPIQVDEVGLGPAVRHKLPGAAGVWKSFQAPGVVEPVTGGAISSAFFSPFALTIDTVGMRLFITQGGPS
jgi:predicted aspartyl protease